MPAIWWHNLFFSLPFDLQLTRHTRTPKKSSHLCTWKGAVWTTVASDGRGSDDRETNSWLSSEPPQPFWQSRWRWWQRVRVCLAVHAAAEGNSCPLSEEIPQWLRGGKGKWSKLKKAFSAICHRKQEDHPKTSGILLPFEDLPTGPWAHPKPEVLSTNFPMLCCQTMLFSVLLNYIFSIIVCI